MQLDSTTMQMLIKGIGETLYMVFLSSALSYVTGIPLGIALVVTDKDGTGPVPLLNEVLGLVIDILRSIPFITLLIIVIPITRTIVGKIIGCNVTMMPPVIAAVLYVGRMVEPSLKKMDAGVMEAVRSMGASTWQIIMEVLLPEAKPSLLVGAAISVIMTLGYFVVAGLTGGGGLGDIAIRYGYHRYQTDMMMVTVVLPIITVQLIQEVFMRMSRGGDKRVR